MIKGIELTVLFGPGVPVPAPRVVIDALQSVRIEENAGETQSGFELVFAIEKNSPLNILFLLAGGAAIPILRVALSATINGRPTSLINGVVTKADLTPGHRRRAGDAQRQGQGPDRGDGVLRLLRHPLPGDAAGGAGGADPRQIRLARGDPAARSPRWRARRCRPRRSRAIRTATSTTSSTWPTRPATPSS